MLVGRQDKGKTAGPQLCHQKEEEGRGQAGSGEMGKKASKERYESKESVLGGIPEQSPIIKKSVTYVY